MIFFYLIVLFAWTTKGLDESTEQVRMLKEYLKELKNPFNPEDRNLLLASVYQGIRNLSYTPHKEVYFSHLLPFILGLEENDSDTRFTRLFFNACYCATRGIEKEPQLSEFLVESVSPKGEISDSRYINSISTAMEQATAFKSDYVLPGEDDSVHARMKNKLTGALMNP
jgi:hypothetical protein